MVSERKQPHFCVRVLLAASGRGEGSGGVFFYEHSSCSPCQDKASLSYPQCTEMEGERRQAVPREMLSREQAGDSSRPASPGMVGGTTPFWSRRLMSQWYKGDEKNQQEPPLTEGLSRRKGGPKVRSRQVCEREGHRLRPAWLWQGDQLSPFVWDRRGSKGCRT